MPAKRIDETTLSKLQAAEVAVPSRSYSDAAEPAAMQILEPLLRRWWVLVLCGFAALGAAFLYLKKTPKIYESSAQIYIHDNPVSSAASPVAFTRGASFLNSQAALIHSTAVLALALKAPGMEQLAAAHGAYAVDFLKGGLQVRVDPMTELIILDFTGTDPNENAQAINGIISGYSEYKRRDAEATVDDVLAALRSEKEKCDRELASKVQAQQDFIKANIKAADLADVHDVTEEELKKISTDLGQAQVELSRAELDHASVVEAAKTPESRHKFVQSLRFLGTLGPDEGVSNARAELKRLKAELAARIADGALDKDRDVIALNNQIRELDPDSMQSQSEEQTFSLYRQGVESKLGRLRDAQAMFQKEYNDKQTLMQQTGMQVLDFRRRKTDYDNAIVRAEKLVDAADERLKNVSIASGAEGDTIRVLEAARPAFLPTKPVVWQVFAIAGALGLMLGTGSVLLYDHADQRLRTAQDFSAELTVPVLGVVPHMSGRRTIGSRGQEFLLNPSSEVSEAFRALRTALYFGVQEGQVKTLVVTSPMARDGKSTLVSNLGIAMAQAGRRTLIVDADFRKPAQQSIFSLQQDVGLSNVLNGTALLKEAIASTHVRGLHVLSCGALPDRPSESLNSQRFASILKAVSQHYDYVLLDSPPVGQVADALILGAISDATMLVLRAEKSTRAHSVESRDRLLSVGAQLLGIVVNDVRDRQATGYGTYGLPARDKKAVSRLDDPHRGDLLDSNAGTHLPVAENGNGHANGHANGDSNGSTNGNGGGSLNLG